MLQMQGLSFLEKLNFRFLHKNGCQETLNILSVSTYRLYTERRSASETATEFIFCHFYRSEPTHKSQRIKLLDVIAICNQSNVNALN